MVKGIVPTVLLEIMRQKQACVGVTGEAGV